MQLSPIDPLETLLSFSVAVTSVRDKSELLLLVREHFSELLAFTNMGMASLNSENETCYPNLSDPRSISKKHPDYEQAVTMGYPLYGAIFEKAYRSERPVVFLLDQ